MKYLKEYNNYNNVTIDDIKECFIDIIDMDIDVKVSKAHFDRLRFTTDDKINNWIRDAKGLFKVSISLDNKLKSSISEFGVKYRAVINGEEIINLFVDGIRKCEGHLGLDILRGELKWVNAGEWSSYKRKEIEKSRNTVLKQIDDRTRKGEDKEAIESYYAGLLASYSNLLDKIGAENGPGILERIYTPTVKKISDDSKFLYSMNTQDMEADILSKGDRIRNIVVYFLLDN